MRNKIVSLIITLVLVISTVLVLNINEAQANTEASKLIREANNQLRELYGLTEEDYKFETTNSDGRAINVKTLYGEWLEENRDNDEIYGSIISYGEPHGDRGNNKRGVMQRRYIGYTMDNNNFTVAVRNPLKQGLKPIFCYIP
ncbi:hypothetical protein RBH29_17110 [Herbivorax sp. ANBcel31]|uniref:hypothetical protein n=1 Tax=Herbivorax sp. ANBcel31 TaxID=3069754 RepID=UPI0027AF8D5E|nr:hypothetical protein [Herbivorax sp. ANBcel31]MDQ2088147.1 hypothetical protein [Herbivorax sp. ANBcel31]